MAEAASENIFEWVRHFYRCSEWINAALEYAGGTHDLQDVFDGIAAGEYQFWWHPDGCIVTEVLDYPKMRVAHHWLAGGSMEAMQELEARIDEWARSQGCGRVTLAGRLGWTRTFLRDRGYSPFWTVMAKELQG